MKGTVEGIGRNLALSTDIDKNTQELEFELVPLNAALAQTMPNCAVRVIGAIEDGEPLPRGFAEACHCECEFCSHVPCY